jgi:hypothetical protein
MARGANKLRDGREAARHARKRVRAAKTLLGALDISAFGRAA